MDRLSARLQIHPRVRLPLNLQRRLRHSPGQMSNNHYGLLRTNSEENIDYLPSNCDENNLAASTSSSFYEFSDVSVLLKQIETLYLSDQMSDVTLLVDNECFPCHKIILGSRSSYFRAMFFGGMREQLSNEVQLQDVPIEAFRLLLKYIYSGRIRFQSIKFDVILDVFTLVHKFSFQDLEVALCEYLKHILDHSNVISVYSMAYFYELEDLLKTCLDFIDRNAMEVLKTDAFLQLNGQSLYDIFSRDSFYVPEIDIFNQISRWIQQHPNEKECHKTMLSCVRLSLIKIEDLLTIVRPTNLFDADLLLDTINQQTNKGLNELSHRGVKLIGTNVCTLASNARVIEGDNVDSLLRNDPLQRIEAERCTRHIITENEQKCIMIELGLAYIINVIELYLFNRDQMGYSYYVETSMDKQDWTRVIDHTHYICRFRQQLYFHPRVVKYIKIVGTQVTLNRTFYLTAIKAMFINKTFNIDPDSTLLKPTENVASIGSGAIVIEGVSRSRNELINGNYDQYDWNQGYTCHQIGSAAIVIQFPQPYLVDSLRLLLWDIDDRCYSFDIDVSCDGQEWTQIIKAHELRSWVAMKFKMIPVVFIRITGTFNTANEIFHVVHFECPAKPGTVFKTDVQDEFPIIYGFQKLSLNESDRPDEKEVPSEDKIEE